MPTVTPVTHRHSAWESAALGVERRFRGNYSSIDSSIERGKDIKSNGNGASGLPVEGPQDSERSGRYGRNAVPV
ncbi:hypothetical protein [Kamptonema formosum]|uniref:hypothetical protein n=1 Tax=Kamptonema formosum TaxID=331992 RepID=UPI0012DF5B48|nr:hypothetical protein [Oscillatoria sp. PCC 10802]